MKTYQYIISAFAFFLFFSSCKEDYVEPTFFGDLEGQVVNADDLSPIANAIITVSPINTTAVTDADGRFLFTELPVGGHTLEVKLSGFRTELLSVEVLREKTTEFDVFMETAPITVTTPGTPSLLEPADFASEQKTALTLSWLPNLADESQDLTFDVYLFKQGTTEQSPVAENLTEPLFEISDLEYETTYHWQVVVSNMDGKEVFGPIWTFTTSALPFHRFRWVRSVDNVFQIFCSDEFGEAIQLSGGAASCWRPKLSPDRAKIAFLSNDGIATHLFTMDTNGENVTRVTDIPLAGIDVMDLDYCWSPNSGQLLYPSNDRLFLINQDGTGLQTYAEAPEGKQFVSVDWSELDNNKVVRMSGNNVYESEIHLIDASGNWSILVEDLAGRTGNPSFSIEGTEVVYTHDVSGFENVNGRQLDSHVFLFDLETGTATDLSFNKAPGTNDLDPSFSPTGSEIIFTNTPNDGVSERQLGRMGLNGEERNTIISNAEMADWH